MECVRLLAQNVVSVNPDAAAVTMRPVTGHPDVAAAVINVIWPTGVIWTVPHRDHVSDARRGGHGRPINRRTCSSRKENSEEKDHRFFHSRCFEFMPGPVILNGFVEPAALGWAVYGTSAPGGVAK